MTSASISTKGSPALTPPAPTLTNATSLDALQPTQERTTLTPQALDPPSQRLAAQAIPPEGAIEYLSKLSPTTPIDLSQLALYLHDHPDRASVDAVLTGLSQGFKIGFQGPRFSKEYPNLISARQNIYRKHIVSTNLLKELQLGHTAGPFVSPPFPNFQVYPIGVVPKKHSTEWRTIFHLFLGGDVLSLPDLQLFADASGSHGYGGYLNGEWFQATWLPQHLLNPTMGISIDWQELFAIYIACYLWGPSWSGKHICMRCDNLPVVSIINSKRFKSPRIMDLVRAITILTLEHNFSFTARYIPGLDNSVADSLSRFQMDRFRHLAPNASPSPCVVPPSATSI